MVIVAPGSASPVCWSVIFPETENWADARNGNSKATNAANKFFNLCVNKNVKPSVHQGTMYSTLNLLPLPTPALPGSGVCLSLESEVLSSEPNATLDFGV